MIDNPFNAAGNPALKAENGVSDGTTTGAPF